MAGPLSGLLVVSLEQAVAAPFASRHLSDLGARVIKIERPGEGDFARHFDDVVYGLSSHFVWLNRNKESVALDVKHEAGRAALERILSSADVFLQNLAPHTAAELGLSASQVVERHARIVACDISGYGDGGPLGDRRAYDLLVQAESASVTVTGWPDRPAKPGIAVADIGAGMYTYSSILAGLYERERTGRGRAIAVSLFDAICEWMGYTVYYSAHSGQPHRPVGIGHPSLSPYGSFETADGTAIVVGVQNDREWQRLVRDVFDRPDLVADASLTTNSGRVAQRERVTAECARWFKGETFATAASKLDAADIANARLVEPMGLLAHPQLTSRERWRDVESPHGTVRSLLPPAVSDGWDPRMDPIPSIGEHTTRVLREFGYSDGEIDSMRVTGAAQ